MELFAGRTSTILENDKRPNLTAVVKRDADTGEPVPDTVFPGGGGQTATAWMIKTGADGAATLENLLPGV